MRIATVLPLTLSLLLLAACAAGEPVGETARYNGGLGAADAYCGGRYDRGSFDYDVCYRNRPEVQAHGRGARMNSLDIINTNRSPRTWQGRSYPVE